MSKLLSFLFLFSLPSIAQHAFVDVVDVSSQNIQVTFNNGDVNLSSVEFKGGTFSKIHVDGLTKSYDVGNPDLPVYSKLIEVPPTGEIKVSILDENSTVIDLTSLGFHQEILPAQPSIFKNDNPDKIKLQYNESVYSTDAFYRQELIKVERLGVMRGKHIARIQIAPFSYHPLTNELMNIEQLSLNIEFSSHIPTQDISYKSVSFEANFSKLLNPLSDAKNEFVNRPIRMVVLADPMFEDALQEFISWKRRLGFQIDELYKGEGVGYTASELKANIQSLYDNATEENPAPTYLLIVGDHEQIPSFEVSGHVSDMYYCEFDGGSDYFPEMYYGRFSASTVEELTPQIEKTIQYEGYSMPDPSYLGEALMVAGVDGYFAETHGNGQINYGNEYYFNEEHGISSHTFLYPESSTSAAEEAIVTEINQGVGFANYTAHCSYQGWSDPVFELDEVMALQNEDQYGLMIGNCCQSNTFDGVTCLGESLLRASKKGAVGYIGGSNNTLWDEDYYWGVGNGPVSANPTYDETTEAIYDCSFHENGELEEDWSISQGQIIHAGNWAVTESGSSNTQYYWEIYHLMGDPSVMTYYGVPSVLSVNHPAALTLGTSNVSVNTEQYAYVAVNQGGVLLDASYTDASGNVVLSFNPLSSIEPIEIVASKQNRQIYISDINVMSSDAPFVAFSSLSIDDGIDGNGMVENGENFSLDINLENYGLVDAQDLELTISCSNTNVLLVGESIQVEAISSTSMMEVENAVNILLLGTFQDQESVLLTFTVVDSPGNEWVSYGSFTVNAPTLEISSHLISDDDGNGFVDFGESAQLSFEIENIGHATSLNGTAMLTTDNSWLQIIDSELVFESINPGETITVLFPVQLDELAPAGENYQITLYIESENGYTDEYAVNLTTSNCEVGAMEVQVFIETDYYAEEVAWDLTTSDGAVIGQAALGSLDHETLYEEVFCLQNNTFLTFEIIDDYGDGLFSEGYSIVVCGETIASGADYGYGESISFIAGCDQNLEVGCTDPEASNYNPEAVVEDGSCEEIGLDELSSQIKLYPNPAENYLEIHSSIATIESVSILDLSGKSILNFSCNHKDVLLPIERLNPGNYFVQLKNEEGLIATKRLVVL